MTKDMNSDLFYGPKWPQNWAYETHISHTAKSTCSEHVKQYWCETITKRFEKITKDPYFYLFGGPK